MRNIWMVSIGLVLTAFGCSTGQSAENTGSMMSEPIESGDQEASSQRGGWKAIDLQGHRGARGLRPESTLPAFERTTVQSFDHRSIWAVHRLDPSLDLAALEAERGGRLGKLAERGATVWSPNHELVDAASLDEAHDAGLQVIPWTVNDRQRMRRLIELGVDGSITDRPDLAR